MKRGTLAALASGLSALAAFAVELLFDARHAAYAYLAAYTFAMSTALGALLSIVVLTAASAKWFVVLRRLAGAAASTLWLYAAAFLPVAASASWLYPFARPASELEPGEREATAHLGAWMSLPLYWLRSGVYLALFLAVLALVRGACLRDDRAPSPKNHLAARLVSCGSMPLLGLGLSFAAFDWLMPLQAGWTSTIFGVYFFAGSLASALGLLAVLAHLARRAGLLPPEVAASHTGAVGRLLLMSVILWAYMAYCQLLIIWIADLPREVVFYEDRVRDGWLYATIALGAGHFVVPFLLLLPYGVKRRSGALAAVGAWVVLMHALDAYWLVVPASGEGARGLDLLAFVGLGGLGVAFGAWRFSSAAPVPRNDPWLAESLGYRSP